MNPARGRGLTRGHPHKKEGDHMQTNQEATGGAVEAVGTEEAAGVRLTWAMAWYEPASSKMYPLWKTYPGRDRPQPAFLHLQEDGRATFDYDPELSGGVPEAVFLGRCLRWPVCPNWTTAECEAVFNAVRPLLERIHAGRRIVFVDRSQYRNRAVALNADAMEANLELASELEGWVDHYNHNGKAADLPPSEWYSDAENASLHDYQSGERLRPATAEERRESLKAALDDGGRGVFDVDGRSCYVEG